MKPIRLHRSATAELNEAVSFYEQALQGLGEDLLEEVDEALHRIRHVPTLHSLYKDTGFRKCVLRRFPFNLFYAERDAYIIE